MALIPPDFLDCVVAIGVDNPSDQNNPIKWVGTGFLVGRFFKKDADEQNQYHVFLITNKHVLVGKNSVKVRFNPHSSEPAKDYDLTLINDGNKRWTGHQTDEIDVAAIDINPRILVDGGMKFKYFVSDSTVLSIEQMADAGMTEGDFIYVLGFPMGLVDSDRQYVIARSGSIARIRDVLEKRSNDFIVDSFVFPGNSGGPVVSKPEFTSITGTQSINSAYLIGIVSKSISYQDTAISLQTKRPRIIFEDNSGLAVVIPTDFIMETIEDCFIKLNIKDEPADKSSGKDSS